MNKNANKGEASLFETGNTAYLCYILTVRKESESSAERMYNMIHSAVSDTGIPGVVRVAHRLLEFDTSLITREYNSFNQN